MPASPLKRIHVTARRSTPNLEAYVERWEFGFAWKNYVLASCIVSVVGALGVLVTAGLVAAGVLGPGLLLWIFTNVFGLSLFGGLGTAWWLRSKRPPDLTEALMQEARPVAAALRESIMHHRLHRQLHPEVVDLLEEAARCWTRVHEATSTTFWKSEALPPHYRGIREQARLNADQAMMEVLLHLRSGVKPVGEAKTLMEGLQSVFDAIGISFSSAKVEEPLPQGFEAAAEVASSLSELAGEIESTSIRAIKTSTAELESGQSIRRTLEELRQIREAESELDQELRA